MTATRRYVSKLRSEQTKDTRERILAGAARITLFDATRITHATVAHSAGVAERTVYRHFPTLSALHDAFAKYQEQRFGRDQGEELSLDELPATYERWPDRIESTPALDYVMNEQVDPPIATKSRRKRYERLERALKEVVPEATQTQVRQLVLVFGALLSPEVFRRAKVLLRMDPRQVVPGPAWALRVLIERLRKGDAPWK
jgi:AcrR family transcriptional regulator